MDTLMECKRSGDVRSRLRRECRRARAAAAQVRAARPSAVDAAGPLARRRDRRPGLHAAVPRRRASPRASRSTTSPRYINETALFRNQWQFRPERRGENDDEFKARIRPTLRASSSTRPRPSGVLVPAGRVGLLPGQRRRQRPRRVDRRRPHAPSGCGSASRASARSRSSASPTSSGRSESGEADYAAFHVVTMGDARQRARRPSCSPPNRYQEYLLLHGLVGRDDRGARRAAGTAASARSGASPTRTARRSPACSASSTAASRYSWGYPACPDLEDQAKLAELLERRPHRRRAHRGVPAQYEPEQTTSAIICPHPEAKYFVAR